MLKPRHFYLHKLVDNLSLILDSPRPIEIMTTPSALAKNLAKAFDDLNLGGDARTYDRYFIITGNEPTDPFEKTNNATSVLGNMAIVYFIYKVGATLYQKRKIRSEPDTARLRQKYWVLFMTEVDEEMEVDSKKEQNIKDTYKSELSSITQSFFITTYQRGLEKLLFRAENLRNEFGETFELIKIIDIIRMSILYHEMEEKEEGGGALDWYDGVLSLFARFYQYITSYKQQIAEPECAFKEKKSQEQGAEFKEE